MTDTRESDRDDAGGYFKVYEEYSKTLRTWFVAYGIGAPVFVLTGDTVRAEIIDADIGRSVGAMFLTGVGLQVALAAVNKATMWVLYDASNGPREERERWYVRFSDWMSGQFWIDLLVDLVTGVLFAVATYKIFSVVAG